MFKSRRKFKNNYLKELMLATVLFCLPLLISIHKFFQEDIASEFTFFGLTFKNTLHDDQVMLYIFLLPAITFLYILFFFFHTRGTMKLTLLLPIFWLIYDQGLSLFYMIQPIDAHRKILSFLLASTAVFLLVHLFVPNLSIFKILTRIKRLPNNSASFMPLGLFCLLYGYTWIPSDLNIFFIGDLRIDSFLYQSFKILFYLLGIKLSLLLVLLGWYFLEKKWWKYALLSPILITVYQLKTFFNNETEILDETEILNAFPILLLIALALIALSKNAKDQYMAQSIYEKVSLQIEKLLEQRNQKQWHTILATKQRLANLKRQKKPTTISDLMKLKKQLENELGRN